jgi:predicted DNA-binding transcriptional regulator AlpA
MATRKRGATTLPRYISTKRAKTELADPGNALFWKWVKEGEFGPPIRMGQRKLIWESAKIVDFVERRARESYTPNYTRGMAGHADKLDAESAERVGEHKSRRDPKLDCEAAKHISTESEKALARRTRAATR